MLTEWARVKFNHAMLRWIWRTQFRTSFSAVKMRENFERLSASSIENLSQKYPTTSFRRLTLGGVPAEFIETIPNPAQTILFVHGGGFIMGSIESYRRNALRIAYRTQSRVVLFDYRRAPEHPYPAALVDVLAVYETLIEQVTPRELIFAGDSAGGGLVLSALMALRDHGKALPISSICISPFADLTLSGNSIRTRQRQDGSLTPKLLTQCAEQYAGKADRRQSALSPVFGDFRGLPPMLVMAGDSEILFDDASRIVAQARHQGVDVEFYIGKGMQHVWFFSLPTLAGSKRAMSHLADYVARFKNR